MGQVIQVILTYAGPHRGTSEDVDKGKHGVWSNKAEPSKPPFRTLLATFHPLLSQVTPFDSPHSCMVQGQQFFLKWWCRSLRGQEF